MRYRHLHTPYRPRAGGKAGREKKRSATLTWRYPSPDVAYIWPSHPVTSVSCPLCEHVAAEEPVWAFHFQHVKDSHPDHWQKIMDELEVPSAFRAA